MSTPAPQALLPSSGLEEADELAGATGVHEDVGLVGRRPAATAPDMPSPGGAVGDRRAHVDLLGGERRGEVLGQVVGVGVVDRPVLHDHRRPRAERALGEPGRQGGLAEVGRADAEEVGRGPVADDAEVVGGGRGGHVGDLGGVEPVDGGLDPADAAAQAHHPDQVGVVVGQPGHQVGGPAAVGEVVARVDDQDAQPQRVLEGALVLLGGGQLGDHAGEAGVVLGGLPHRIFAEEGQGDVLRRLDGEGVVGVDAADQVGDRLGEQAAGGGVGGVDHPDALAAHAVDVGEPAAVGRAFRQVDHHEPDDQAGQHRQHDRPVDPRPQLVPDGPEAVGDARVGGVVAGADHQPDRQSGGSGGRAARSRRGR